MNFKDRGIIINHRNFGEDSLIIKIFFNTLYNTYITRFLLYIIKPYFYFIVMP